MPFTQWLLLHVPTIPLALIVIGLALSVSLVGLLFVRKLIPWRDLKVHHELTNAIFGAIALAYTVLLAFVVVVSWQNFDKAKAEVEKEANCLVDIHRNSAAFPEMFREQVRTVLKRYVDVVASEEWPMLARGEESPQARDLLRKLWTLFTSYEPVSEKEKAFFAESVSKLDDLREERRLRIVAARTGVHTVLWVILIIGGLTTVGFTFFFGTDSFRAHLIMASTLSVLIALILFTIFLFDYPFTGGTRIEPETFTQIVNF